jgi:hypothetical protein
MTLDCLVPPEVAATIPIMQVPLEPKALRRASRNAAGKTKGTASASAVPVEDLTGDEDSNTFTFIHKRERPVGPHVEAVAALNAELEHMKNSVGLLAAIPGPGAGDAIAQLTNRMVEIIVKLSALQREQSEFSFARSPCFPPPNSNRPPASVLLRSTSSSSSFDPMATAEMMPDDYTGYNDGSGFYDGDGYRVYQAEDEEDERLRQRKFAKLFASAMFKGITFVFQIQHVKLVNLRKDYNQCTKFFASHARKYFTKELVHSVMDTDIELRNSSTLLVLAQ